ncbi:MAG TPA: hypothetical protein V6D50_08490 [Chroococcales cyanobacterium]
MSRGIWFSTRKKWASNTSSPVFAPVCGQRVQLQAASNAQDLTSEEVERIIFFNLMRSPDLVGRVEG